MRLYLKYVVLCLMILPVQSHAKLYINEILASNNTINYDPHYFNFSDWIEIYNDGNSTVNLDGYTITDDINVPDKYLIKYNLLIEPKGYFTLWADEESWYPHTNFSLRADGEFVALFDPDGELIDSLSFGKQLPDISYGRYPDGSNSFLYMPEPTSKRPNKAGINTATRISDSIIFSKTGGFYDGIQTIELSTQSLTAELRYTLDGSWPDLESELYTSALSIPDNIVIKAIIIDEGLLPSNVYTQTYFIDQEVNLPTISISTDLDYFFDSEYGIYVEGSNGVKGNCTDYPVNYNQPWERAINFEYYSLDGECKVNQRVGTKIAGRCSRTRKIKSLGIYSRKKYGIEGIGEYQFFTGKNLTSPKTLLLRNSGTESYSTYLRDGFMQTLIQDRMDVDYQSYQPTSVFINGEYWGIHNLREKMNEHYVNSNYGIDPNSIDLLEYNTKYDDVQVVQGDRISFDNFYNYISNNDLRLPENYSYVKSQMDVGEFMNLHIANIYFENEDWPNNNNKFWRKRTPDGKWRWYMFDLDFGFGYWPKSGNTVEWLFGDRDYTRIAYKLKSNEDFRNEFAQRIASHLNTTFKTERVLTVLDSLKGNIEQEIINHIDKWRAPYSYSKWERNLQVMVDFANARTAIVTEQIMDEFNLSGTYDLELENESPNRGKILVSGVDIPNDFVGFYFIDIPLRIQAIPKPGYQFSGWSGDVNASSAEILLTSDADKSIIAHFESTDTLKNLFINEFLASNIRGSVDEYFEHEDWIEIYNSNNYPVDLAGLYLSDSLGFLTQSQIPFGEPENTTIPAKGYKLLWADNEPMQGSLHLSHTKLSKRGEMIILSQQISEEIQIMDSITFTKQYSDVTYGRDPEESELWKFLNPTPKAENHEKIIENIFINEFMTSNNTVLQDVDGNFDDWIELYNANDYEVDIAGMFISDDPNNLNKHRIPNYNSDSTTIPAQGYLVLWADDSTEQGIRHLIFKLSSSGEQIILSQPNGLEIVDSITYPDLIADAPYGRTIDGFGNFTYLLATPGASNAQPSFQGLYINEFMATNQTVLEDRPGEFDDWIELYNDNDYPVNIAGLFLSDNIDEKIKFRVSTAYPDSTTIPAKGHILIWADDSTEQGILHAGFKLSGNGEQIIVSSTTGEEVIDSITYPDLIADAPYGRTIDAFGNFTYLLATPGASNAQPSFQGLYINEFMATNQTVLEDRPGEFDDWIELYNDNDYPVNVGGVFLSDNIDEKIKFRVSTAYPDSTTIPAKGHILIWADDSTEQGILHAGFKLSGNGEQIIVSSTTGEEVIDSITYGDIFSDAPYGRISDGDPVFGYLTPTPGESNSYENIDNIFINEVLASNSQTNTDGYGDNNDWIELYNGNNYAVNIGGLFITDDYGIDLGYRIPTTDPELTTIPAKGYKLIWADDSTEQGILHTNFKLTRTGEQIVLLQCDGIRIADSLSFGSQQSDISVGRISDGAVDFAKQVPTPGTANKIFNYQGIQISEVMASDHAGYADDHGEYEDWIELYNSSTNRIDIAGMVVSDSLGRPDRYFIPGGNPELTTIQPDEYLVIWADDSIEQGVLHVGFGLSESGEQVGIFTTDGSILDSVTYPNQYNNFSYSKLDPGVWMAVPPTAGEMNEVETFENLYINEYMSDNENRFMDESGEYDDWIEIYNDNTYPVNLAGLYLSDSLPKTNMYRIPSNNLESTEVPAKGHAIIWTDSDSDQGALHTNFKLSRSGEDLLLSAYDYRETIDSRSFDKQYSNFASGRLNDNGPWTDMPPTPGMTNIMPDLSHLFINEIMTSNLSTMADNYGEYDDWIEFYNGGNNPIDLGGLFISDTISTSNLFRISSDQPDSTTIQPNEYLLIWADDATEQGVLHANFKLSRSGEQVAIYYYDSITVIDSVTYSEVLANRTYGRYHDGSTPWKELRLPTPLKDNWTVGKSKTQFQIRSSAYTLYPNPVSDEVIISMGIDHDTEVFVKIFDRTGNLVAIPVDRFFTSGSYEISWALKSNIGVRLETGIYFYVIETDRMFVQDKLIILKQ